jgi:hypothetical protein
MRSKRWTASAAHAALAPDRPGPPPGDLYFRGPRPPVNLPAWRGFYVAFDFTEDAKRECVRHEKRTGRIIKLLTVQKIPDEEHVQKM